LFTNISATLGPGVSSGSVKPSVEAQARKEADAYPGYQTFILGNVDGRFVKVRAKFASADGIIKLSGFSSTLDQKEREEKASGVSVPSTGLAVTFSKAFHVKPFIKITVEGNTALIPTKDNVTTTGFTIHVFDAAGTEVGGTVDWSATGV